MYPYTPDPDAVTFKAALNLPDSNDKPTGDFIASLAGPILANTAYLKARGVQDIQLGTSAISQAMKSLSWADFTTSGGFVPYVDIADCKVGDHVLVFATGQVAIAAGDNAELRLTGVEDYGGAGTTAPIPGASTALSTNAGSAIKLGCTMIGRLYVSTAGDVRVKLQGKAFDVLSGFTLSSFTMIAVRVRLYT